jgi:hypothetical protein
MNLGNLFEELVTGKENDSDQYIRWKATSVSEAVMRRTEIHAIRARKLLGINKYKADNQLAVRIEIEVMGFLLTGEIDILGKVDIKGETFGGVVDIKYSGDPSYNWDVGGPASPAQYLQVAIYALAIATINGDKKLLEEAARAKSAMDPAWVSMAKEWGKGTTIIPGLFVIADTAYVPGDLINLRYIQVPAMSPEECVALLEVLHRKAAEYEYHLNIVDDLGLSEALNIVDPSPAKCLAEGVQRETFCPMLQHCKYGQQMLQSIQTISVNEILGGY